MGTLETVTNEQINQLGIITQAEIVERIRLKNQIAKDQEALDTLETTIKNALVAGAKVEGGVHTAEVKMTERRTPKWKEEAIALADKLKGKGEGDKWAEKILEKTEPTSSVRLLVDGK